MKNGLLLINIGTPDRFDTASVRGYLSEFLMDRRVIDLPAFLRYILVYAIILPFRAKKSAHAYKAIWTKEGSPLMKTSQLLLNKLQDQLKEQYQVALGMRYGHPSISSALNSLRHCETITILPLYPQYSSAATGSALEQILKLYSLQEVIPSLKIISDFYHHPSYINAQAQIIKDHLNHDEHLIFSYHGIPERQIIRSGCLQVCKEVCPTISERNQKCYKAQCHQTSLLLANELQLNGSEFTTTFQSRLGKTPWIKPYTDVILQNLIEKGIKKIAIACPSFVTDCLETLEEIGIRAKEQWMALGGEQFTLIPCLNIDPRWLNALEDILHS